MRGALIGCGFLAQNHLNARRDLSAEAFALVEAACQAPGAGRAAAPMRPRVFEGPR
jgi:hypothetical protein